VTHRRAHFLAELFEFFECANAFLNSALQGGIDQRQVDIPYTAL